MSLPAITGEIFRLLTWAMLIFRRFEQKEELSFSP
jgi:hypothetical protein